MRHHAIPRTRPLARPVAAVLGAALAVTAFAKVDMVTLPERERVQVTIYNSADLTLVRESRPLTLREGRNRLQFSWENTLIDPTSLELAPVDARDAVDVLGLAYPPRIRNLGIWEIESELSGAVPMEVRYLTSGLSWQHFMIATLDPDESAMRLNGYVRVFNRSGEDYENAETRVIVGTVHLLDQIAALAGRDAPYGRPDEAQRLWKAARAEDLVLNGVMVADEMEGDFTDKLYVDFDGGDVKEIVKEGLSEYFLYTIEGTETIRNGWSKRLPSLGVDAIPIENLYKHEPERWGDIRPIRFLSFANDEDHELGDTPIPDGPVKVFRRVDDDGRLAYLGADTAKYIPVGEEAELNLGAVDDIEVEPKMMDLATDGYRFDRDGNVSGWQEAQTWEVRVANRRGLPARVEVTRNFPMSDWELVSTGDDAGYEKIDLDTVRYTVEMPPHSERTLGYKVTFFHGDTDERR